MNKSALEQHDRVLAESFRDKTILITGSTGLIGSNVVHYLAELNDRQRANITVVALYRDARKRDRLFSEWLHRDDVRFVKGDIEEGIPCEGMVDYIIHAAGISGGVKMHLKEPVKMFDVGVNGTKNALDFAGCHGCRGFVFLSSYEVYSDHSTQGLIDERCECPIDPFSLRSLYAGIKLACEALLCAWSAQYGIPVYSARLTSTFGSGVRYDDPRFFAEFGRCILEGRDIVLKTEGKTVRSYLDARDAATALLYILARGESRNAYNVTNMHNEISIRDMALKMVEVSEAPIQVVIENGSSESALGFRRQGRTVMDAAKLQVLGWMPIYTLEETIQSLLRSMKNAKRLEVRGEEEQ